MLFRSQKADPILSSEHFELAFPVNQQPWAGETLKELEALRRALGERADLLPGRVRVQTWESTEQFIRATGQRGWAAASNNGRSIGLQPLATLKRKGILTTTLRHELTHLAVHPLRAKGIPQWFEEGMVLYLTGEQVGGVSSSNFKGRSLETTVSKPRSESEMKSAYARALNRVRGLARQRGEAALWQVLQHPTEDDLRWLRN